MPSTPLPTRQLGKNGPQVTALGFGAMGIGAPVYGKVDSDDERLKFLDRMYELGLTNIDTADGYGDSEDLIGKWFQRSGKRDDIFLATKFSVYNKPDGTREFRNDPEWIRFAIDRSLKRLQTDRIDLWYCHRVNGQVPIETIVETMAESVKAGKVKHLGLSECSASTLRRAHAVWPIAAVQVEYSPLFMDIESPRTGLLQTCRELGVAVIAYSPLGRGLFTGRFKSLSDFQEGDYRLTAMPRFFGENFHKNLHLVRTIEALAERKGCTVGQMTLAWLMRQGEDIIPIPGTKSVKYLEENLGALDVVLSDQENKEIREAVEQAEVFGDRYNEAMIGMQFLDTPPRGALPSAA